MKASQIQIIKTLQKRGPCVSTVRGLSKLFTSRKIHMMISIVISFIRPFHIFIYGSMIYLVRILKRITSSTRPLYKAKGKPSYSFPSEGLARLTFTLYSIDMSPYARYIVIMLASMTRIYTGHHYIQDVAVGIAIGWIFQSSNFYIG